MAIGSDAVRGQIRFSEPRDLDDLYRQLQPYLEREQNGGINQLGLRIQLRATVPVDAPAANQPNYVLIENPGGLGPQPYVYVSGTGWVAVAQTALPAAHVLATTAGIGPQHSVSGLTSGQVLVATSATAAHFAALTFAQLSGNLAYAQLPSGNGTWTAVVAGLDADKLDGLHGSGYALASHTHPASQITSGTFAGAGDYIFPAGIQFGAATAAGNILPGTDSTYNLGSSGAQWASVFANSFYGNGSFSLTSEFTGTVSLTLDEVSLAIFLAGCELYLSAGTTDHASMRIPVGVAPTSPQNGQIWYDGTDLYFRNASTSKKFVLL